MSQADAIALVDRFFEAINAGQGDSAAACLGEDVVFDIADGQRRFGPASLRDLLSANRAHGALQYTDIAILVSEDGTRAAAEFTLRGRRRQDTEQFGEAFSLPGGVFLAIEDGKIIRITPADTLAGMTLQSR